jgi:hypothetical protein
VLLRRDAFVIAPSLTPAFAALLTKPARRLCPAKVTLKPGMLRNALDEPGDVSTVESSLVPKTLIATFPRGCTACYGKRRQRKRTSCNYFRWAESHRVGLPDICASSCFHCNATISKSGGSSSRVAAAT